MQIRFSLDKKMAVQLMLPAKTQCYYQKSLMFKTQIGAGPGRINSTHLKQYNKPVKIQVKNVSNKVCHKHTHIKST